MSSSKVEEWSTGLCNCFSDWRSCCLGFWCPCVAFGRTAEIVDKGATSCCEAASICVTLYILLGCSWIYTCSFRSRLRQQYSLKSTPCHDCLVHWCCTPCTICQEYRELQNRGFDMSLGWEGNAGRQPRGVSMAPVVDGGMKR